MELLNGTLLDFFFCASGKKNTDETDSFGVSTDAMQYFECAWYGKLAICKKNELIGPYYPAI
jgi:hypothetical protein